LRRNYATVKIPVELAAKLDVLVSNQGYHSRAEVVNDAIRRFIDERRRLEVAPVPERATAPQQQQSAPMIRT
jgi:metal-responsive CopG/Arc/MetJ family transcriptional regulator